MTVRPAHLQYGPRSQEVARAGGRRQPRCACLITQRFVGDVREREWLVRDPERPDPLVALELRRPCIEGLEHPRAQHPIGMAGMAFHAIDRSHRSRRKKATDHTDNTDDKGIYCSVFSVSSVASFPRWLCYRAPHACDPSVATRGPRRLGARGWACPATVSVNDTRRPDRSDLQG